MTLSYRFVRAKTQRKAEHFDNLHYEALFNEYLTRSHSYLRSELRSCRIEQLEKELSEGSTHCWVCHTGKRAREVSSNTISEKLVELQNNGVKKLTIVVGPPEGFDDQDLERIKPKFKWKLSELTFPHELAMVVCAEQMYRALCIMQNHPYHK